MAISPAPKRKDEVKAPVQINAKTEQKIRDVINRGGSTSNKPNNSEQPAVKIVNVHLTTDEIDTIAELRQLRPRDIRSKKKIPVSLHAWLVEAAQEKIDREKKKYGINS